MTALTTRAWVEQIMGLPISIHLRGEDLDTPEVRGAVDAVFAQLREADARFSTYRAESELSRLQRGELTLEQAHPELRHVHEACRQLLTQTDGLFNAWPLVDGEPRFDPTGYVKGWAVDRAAQALRALPQHDFYLNAGGDIALGVNRSDTPPWRIGIENPLDPQSLLDVAEISTGAIATSATYARGEHIYTPQGTAATQLASVTVTGPNLTSVDALATAAFAAGRGAAQWLEKQHGYSALVVSAEGEVTRIRWVPASF